METTPLVQTIDIGYCEAPHSLSLVHAPFYNLSSFFPGPFPFLKRRRFPVTPAIELCVNAAAHSRKEDLAVAVGGGRERRRREIEMAAAAMHCIVRAAATACVASAVVTWRSLEGVQHVCGFSYQGKRKAITSCR